VKLWSLLMVLLFGGAEAAHKIREPHAHRDDGKAKIKSLCHMKECRVRTREEKL